MTSLIIFRQVYLRPKMIAIRCGQLLRSSDFNRLSEEQAFIFQPAAHVQHPTDFDPWGEEDENRVPSGPPSINMNEIRWKVEKELKEYRAVPRLDMRVIVEDGSKGDFIDPLKWWKTHTPSFPTLSVIARK